MSPSDKPTGEVTDAVDPDDFEKEKTPRPSGNQLLLGTTPVETFASLTLMLLRWQRRRIGMHDELCGVVAFGH